MSAYDVAVLIAAGNRFQDLTRPTKALARNHLYRIWRDGGSVLLKVYGTDARERRETHAIEALRGVPGIPVKIDGDSAGDMPWALFEDPGHWSIGSLPGNPDAARRAGGVLRAIHESDPTRLSNLARGIDSEWIDIDHASTMRRLARYRGKVGIDAELYAGAAAVPPPDASQARAAHTDPTPDHFVIAEDGSVTLMDWEWATLAPPEWDLSKAVWLLHARSDSSAAAALEEGYGAALDPVQMNRWIVYHAAMRLVYEAEQKMSDRGTDSYADMVEQLRSAVEAESSE